ncbi:MAG: YggS family pyridoxal phosphate-dependent enzyme [Candidatus Zophobacter franzmannii]|nr:YggS family pyridoxal phosphate-dependent enzyme [Candidatus Zophobacter franzmannii]
MIADNLKIVLENIDKACQRAGRDSDSVKLVAVTKTHPVEVIEELLALGIKTIGENKIQDSCLKIPTLSIEPEFHFIWHFQSNKIKKLLLLRPFLIHSLDIYSTAEKMNAYLEKNGATQSVLIQVNTTDEGQKSGVKPDRVQDFITEVSSLPHIKVMGLMTIGMFSDNPETNRKYFVQLRELSEAIASKQIPGVEMVYLSMGMSDDYEIAIEEGASLIRVGSAIFGQRNYSKEQ